MRLLVCVLVTAACGRIDFAVRTDSGQDVNRDAALCGSVPIAHVSAGKSFTCALRTAADGLTVAFAQYTGQNWDLFTVERECLEK